MIQTLAVANYRSLRRLVAPLRELSLITGANGSGKSNLYRALRLLAETAQGGLIPSLAREGGLSSTLWAGPESFGRSVARGEHPVEGTVRKEPISLRLGFAESEFGYAIDLGLPSPHPPSAFSRDPVIKRECIWNGPFFRPASVLVDRRGPALRMRNDQGAWTEVRVALPSFDSMLVRFTDPQQAPEMLMLREKIRSWRFYDHFRTDTEAPARAPQVGTHTPVLGQDGADLAAALQTIREIGDPTALDAAVADAFPGSGVSIRNVDGRFEVEMRQHGLLRVLKGAELSDGTLRYLLWIAALLTPRPPALLVLNEPETSLHPDLLPALARLVAQASRRTQVLVVSHSAPLIEAFGRFGGQTIRLVKELGETRVDGLKELDAPSWHWPPR
ncbi:MAG: AAA family ATPase [Lentisphaerae bacterium]|nr:AAA family ATPase [Lentisphaerota bacterium]